MLVELLPVFIEPPSLELLPVEELTNMRLTTLKKLDCTVLKNPFVDTFTELVDPEPLLLTSTLTLTAETFVLKALTKYSAIATLISLNFNA